MTVLMVYMLSILSTFIAAKAPSPEAYKAQIEAGRQRRVAALKADDGWLTVAGLFWLKPGSNSVGAAPDNKIVLPAGSAPAHLGVFTFTGGQTSFQAAPGSQVTVNGKRITSAALKPDSSGSPDMLRVNDLTLFVIQRGDWCGVRLRDKNSKMRREFTEIRYFPIREQYRVTARFVPYHPPKKMTVPNILGQIDQATSPGYAEFELNGRTFRLDPVAEGDVLFFIFKDLTSGHETYPPGRFLYAAMPKNGEVVLDFNQAYNPPCAFTPYATCPLPPKENYLPVRIEAGELRYGH